MPSDRLGKILQEELRQRGRTRTLKGKEQEICGVSPSSFGWGPRFYIKSCGDKPFIRMNANSYLGMSFQKEIMEAEEEAVSKFGTGPGAVRFISGTWTPHIELEKRLAEFHGREAAMIFSSAYAAVMGILPSLIKEETAVLSDELNHNCIINAIRLAQPSRKYIYKHLDYKELATQLNTASENCRRAIIVTDGIFSMRGDHADLKQIMDVASSCDTRFPENVLVMADDSHGIGAFGTTGRGTEEYTNSSKVDLLVATLGKALGVNGGYVTATSEIINYLRETSPFYIYSNPITPAEAAAAKKAIDLLDSPQGQDLLVQLRAMTERFRNGLEQLGFETVPGRHPVVPLITRDPFQTTAIVSHLFDNGILATGLTYPVVPQGEDEIRFQLCADHSESDIDEVLDILANRVQK